MNVCAMCAVCAEPAAESCEELFTLQAPHIDLALAGVEIISNGSGSHHQARAGLLYMCVHGEGNCKSVDQKGKVIYHMQVRLLY